MEKRDLDIILDSAVNWLMYKDKTVLITGSTGRLGRYIIDLLVEIDLRLICKFPWHERPSLTKDGQSLYSDYPIKRPTYPFRSMLCNMNE